MAHCCHTCDRPVTSCKCPPLPECAHGKTEIIDAILRELVGKLEIHACVPMYDYAGDSPSLCGFECFECGAEGNDSPSTIKHEACCIIAAARKVVK
jgi:hypothetical protein